MKKIISMVVTIFVILTFFLGIKAAVNVGKVNAKEAEEEQISIEEISEKLIRFHVIANSDTKEDQALKLKIRDEVLKYVQPLLKKSKSIEESRIILNEENKRILDIAKTVIEKNGYDYSVESTLSKEYFPVKSYGNITLPQGEYEAYRIIVGTGKGQNWWCVMFPPICFVDITKGQVAYEETEEQMKRVLTKEEYKMVNDTKMVDNTRDNNIVVKFKLVDMIKKLCK